MWGSRLTNAHCGRTSNSLQASEDQKHRIVGSKRQNHIGNDINTKGCHVYRTTPEGVGKRAPYDRRDGLADKIRRDGKGHCL